METLFVVGELFPLVSSSEQTEQAQLAENRMMFVQR
jgi:hypothetical protein